MTEEKKVKQKKGKYLFVPNEMIEILEVIRENVNYLTWNSMSKIHYTEAFKIIVEKIKKAGIAKKLPEVLTTVSKR